MNKGARFTAAFAGTTFIYEATGASTPEGLPIAKIVGHYTKEDMDADFQKRERLRFETWFAIYGDRGSDKEAQWHGFRGRGHLASKTQNNSAQVKEYRVSYYAGADDQDLSYKRMMATSPKAAMEKFNAENFGQYAIEARRPQ